MWGNSPTSSQRPRGGRPGQRSETSAVDRERQRRTTLDSALLRGGIAEICHHASVDTARGAVAVEGGAIMRRTPAAGGDLADADLVGLPDQPVPQVEVPGPGTIVGHSTPDHHLRSNFIAVATNPYTTMHYYLSDRNASVARQSVEATPQNPGRGASPAGVEQPHHASSRDNQVDRDAIGDRDEEHGAGRARHVSIEAILDHPPAGRVVPSEFHPVYLVGHDEPAEAGLRRPEGAPASHYLPDRLAGPEAQVEAGTPGGTPSGDARHHAEALPPGGDFVTRDWAGERAFGEGTGGDGSRRERAGGLRLAPAPARSRLLPSASSHPVARSPHRALAAARRSARSHARSARRCGWCWCRRRRARRAALPSRPGCRATRRCRP